MTDTKETKSKEELKDELKTTYKKIIEKYIDKNVVIDNIFTLFYGKISSCISKTYEEMREQILSSKPSTEESCRILPFGKKFWEQHVKIYAIPYDPNILHLFLNNILTNFDSGGFRIILEDRLDFHNDPVFVLYMGFALQAQPLKNRKP